MTEENIKRVARRLFPLYCAAFLQGFVIWYSFEKAFIKGIGFTDGTIGLMIAAYSLIMLLAETPSGLLADRWSRKGVLIVASCFLAASSLVGGLSHSVPQYIVANLLWGVYFAMYSGTYDSIIYDTLYEEVGSSKDFDHYYGRVKAYDAVALVLSSLLGAVVGSSLGFRQGYFLTIPFSLIAIVFLLKFNEPKLHRLKVAITIKRQVTSTFNAVARNRDVFIIVLNLVLLNLLTYTVLEFSQLWYIALFAPIAIYGVANAIILAALGAGGAIVGPLKLYKFPLLIASLCLAIVSSLCLVYSRNLYIVIASLFTLTVVSVALTVIFSRLLHDSLESNIRAGSSSAISTFGRVLIIPTAIFLGYLSKEYSIFSAGWVLTGMVILLSIFVIIEARKHNRTALHPKQH